jgi:hypothetical protein
MARKSFAEGMADLHFTSEQAAYLRDLIGHFEAHIGVMADALATLNRLLEDNEPGTRAAYLLILAHDLRASLANARISASGYAEDTSTPRHAAVLH